MSIPALQRPEAFFWQCVAEGCPAGEGLWSQKLASWALPCTAPTKPAGQTCHVRVPHTLRGRQVWLAAKATVCSLTPSARSHRGHLPCWACRVSTRAYTHSEPPPPTRSHTHTPAGTMSRRPAHPLDSSVLMGPGGRGGRPGELPGPQLTEEMPESPAQLWNCVTTGAAGTKAQSHYPRLGGRREDASIPQLSSHTPILEWFAEHRLCADPLLGVSNHIRHALGAGGMEVDTGRGD